MHGTESTFKSSLVLISGLMSAWLCCGDQLLAKHQLGVIDIYIKSLCVKLTTCPSTPIMFKQNTGLGDSAGKYSAVTGKRPGSRTWWPVQAGSGSLLLRAQAPCALETPLPCTSHRWDRRGWQQLFSADTSTSEMFLPNSS